ncbi:WGR domain-containing protein [Nannocystaceae bacterium ST9]
MRRFEFEEGKSHKFWEIEVEGAAFTVRYGKVGTEGQVQTKSYKDEAKASAEADKKIAEKTKKGYVEVAVAAAPGSAPAKLGASKDGVRNPELEEVIFAAPEDPQAWSVYADWLQGEGDPWGERISLGIAHANAKGAEKTKLKKAIDKLDEQHSEHFFGKALAKLMTAEDFEQVAKLDWQYGFVVGIRVAAPEFEWSGTGADTILRAVVKSPAGRFLRSVALGLIDFDGEGDLGKGIDALSKSGTLAAMRDLFVGDFESDETEISWVEVGDVDKLLTVMPNLRSLKVRGGAIGLGKALEHDNLVSLTIETGGLPAAAVKALAKCRLPKLESMEVWFGQKNYGSGGTIKMLEPLFTGEGVPKLVHLGLMNCEFEDEIAIRLAKSPLLARLKSLDLSMGTLRDVGGQAILDAIESFEQLESLDLSHNYMTDKVAKALQKKLGKRVDVSDRKKPSNWGDEDRYYTQIGE